MFIRLKKSSSGKTKVQLCEAIREDKKVRQVIVRHIGVAQDEKHLEELKRLALVIKVQIIEEREGPFLFAMDLSKKTEKNIEIYKTQKNEEPKKVKEKLVDLDNLTEETRVVEGFHDIFGPIFDNLGFNTILHKKKSEVLKHLVLARIANPASKHHTQSILTADFGIDIHIDRIYRMLDSLIENRIAFENKVFHATQQLCFSKINMVLFDVTTLYFESFEEDELRKFGYSKDQKFNMTQVVLALATTEDGLPIGYKCFPGNTADVSTLQKALNQWREELPIGEIRIVGDAAMMSDSNLQALEEANIKYVIAAKLKKLPDSVQKQILNERGTSLSINNETYYKHEFSLSNDRRLVVTYNENRARKNKKDRMRAVDKMMKKIGKGKNVKKLANRGFQKYLKIEGEGKLLIDEQKLAQAETWDGLHGVISNDHDASAKDLLLTYRRLWRIEESFRIQKTNLSIRPIYHFKPERIKAHILLCYLAFCMIRYAEYRIKLQKEEISIEEIRSTLWRNQASLLKDHETGNYYKVPSKPTTIAKKIYQTFWLIRNQKIQKLTNCSAQI